jgi:hypothetical protein
MGWRSLPQIMVAVEDAARAREFAIQFEREGQAERIAEMTKEEQDQFWQPFFRDRSEADGMEDGRESQLVDEWPCCPKCGEPRSTRCTFCGTSGVDFSPADMDQDDLFGLPALPAQAVSDCSCGACGCGDSKSHGDSICESLAHVENPEDDRDELRTLSASTTPLLLCPTCDEPFTPAYFRRCESCGYEFSDGVEIPVAHGGKEPFNWRIAYAMYVMVLLVAGLIVYLLWLF